MGQALGDTKDVHHEDIKTKMSYWLRTCHSTDDNTKTGRWHLILRQYGTCS